MAIFDDRELSFGSVWLGIICYTLQIYFDFSGYSRPWRSGSE